MLKLPSFRITSGSRLELAAAQSSPRLAHRGPVLVYSISAIPREIAGKKLCFAHFCTTRSAVSSLMANRRRATNLGHNMSRVWTPVISTAWSWLPYNWPIYYLDVSMDPSIHLNSIFRSELLRPTSFHIPVHISIFTSFQLRCQSSSRPCEQIPGQCLSLT